MNAIVVGSGLGGLSAAIHLAAGGVAVTVVEAAEGPGGKAGTASVDGVAFDTGPSVLTLPEVFEATFRAAGTRMEDEVALVTASPAFRYVWPDGATVDVFVSPEETLASVRAALGDAAAAELASFLRYAEQIWRAAGPRFVWGPAPRLGALLSLSALRDVFAIDPLRTMAGAIRGRVRDPHVRDILLRYATYNGSDPRSAPATLNCIAHVELGLGGYGVRGGISAMVEALARAAERVGVQFRYGERVQRIVVEGGRARGVETERGTLDADVVVSNADAAHTLGDLIPGARAPIATSTSGWTAVVRASARPRVAHQVLFPERDYAQEFVDLFDHDRVPVDPTVYACDQALAHGRTGWSDGAVPLFVMVNAPAGGEADWGALAEVVRAKLGAAGWAAPGDPIVWSRTPAGLAERFPGSRGALYGAASNGPGAAFRRPANRTAVPGLFLAGGTAHPGGGMPLCVSSGRSAAREILEERR